MLSGVFGFVAYSFLTWQLRSKLLFVFATDLGDYYETHGRLPTDLHEFDRWYFTGHGTHRWPAETMVHVLTLNPEAVQLTVTDDKLPLIIIDSLYKPIGPSLNRFLLARIASQPAYVVDDLSDYYHTHGRLPPDWEDFVRWYGASHPIQRWSSAKLESEFHLDPNGIATGEGGEKRPLVVLTPYLKESETAMNRYLCRHIGVEPSTVSTAQAPQSH